MILGGTKIHATNTIYRRAVRREGKFWQGQFGEPANPADLPARLVAYNQRCQTGKFDKFDFLAKLGPFKHGLSIGCGSAVIERELMRRGIVERFTFVDISEASLHHAVASSPKSIQKRIIKKQQDLNFIELQEKKYDFVFCANVLHHIINLEHVLLEMNKSMTDNGVLLIDDFIGESRFQFSDKRILALNKIGHQAQKLYDVHYQPMSRTSRKALINSCPFEAIRSDELHSLLKELYAKHIILESTYGSLTSWMNVVVTLRGNAQEMKKIDKAVKLFIQEEKKSNLPSLFLFGIYKKNPKPPQWQSEPWSKQELKHHLPVSFIDEGIIMRLGLQIRNLLGERVHNIMRKTYIKIRG